MESGTEQITVLTLFLQADPVVKGVMLILAVASVWSWAIAVDKWLAFGELEQNARKFEREFWSGRSLDDLEDRGDRPRDRASGAQPAPRNRRRRRRDARAARLPRRARLRERTGLAVGARADARGVRARVQAPGRHAAVDVATPGRQRTFRFDRFTGKPLTSRSRPPATPA